MKVAKSLLLGTAAVLATVAGAQAADLPTRKAAPVQYVKICDAYGAGFFYIPGTETCLRVGGLVLAEVAVSNAPNRLNLANVPLAIGGAFAVPHERATDAALHGIASLRDAGQQREAVGPDVGEYGSDAVFNRVVEGVGDDDHGAGRRGARRDASCSRPTCRPSSASSVKP